MRTQRRQCGVTARVAVGRRQAYRSVRIGLAVVALGWVTAVSSAVAATAAFATTPLLLPGITLSAVSCPGADTCEAVGANSSGVGVVVSINHGTVGVTPVPGVFGFQSVSCPSTAFCEAGGQGSSSGYQGVVVTITNGVPGPVQLIAGTSSFAGMSCPSADFCVAVGPDLNGRGVVMTVTNGVPGPVQLIAGTASLNAVSCPSAAFCEAVGQGSAYPQQGAIVPITKGVPGAVQLVGGIAGLSAVSCPTTTFCEAAGIDTTFAQGVVVPITHGVAGAAQSIAGTLGFLAVSCPKVTICEVVGYGRSPSGSQGVVLPIAGGVPGSRAQPISGTQQLAGVACTSTSTCQAVGTTYSSASGVQGVVTTIRIGPTLTTATAASVTVNSPTFDTATFAHGTKPTGQVAFTIFSNRDCQGPGTPVPPPANLHGNGVYTSAPFTPTAPGGYSWAAFYNGDTHNRSVTSTCEPFTVT